MDEIVLEKIRNFLVNQGIKPESPSFPAILRETMTAFVAYVFRARESPEINASIEALNNGASIEEINNILEPIKLTHSEKLNLLEEFLNEIS